MLFADGGRVDSVNVVWINVGIVGMNDILLMEPQVDKMSDFSKVLSIVTGAYLAPISAFSIPAMPI